MNQRASNHLSSFNMTNNKAKDIWIRQTREKLIAKRPKAEIYFWNSLPAHLRRCSKKQHPVQVNGRIYFLDIYIPKKKLAIEIDGSSHYSKQENDDQRDKDLNAIGIKTLRISNTEVFYPKSRELFIEAILDHPNLHLTSKKEKKQRIERQRAKLKQIYDSIKRL